MGTIVAIGSRAGKRMVTIQLDANHNEEPVREMTAAFRAEITSTELFGNESAQQMKKAAETMYGKLEWDSHYCR